MKTRWATHSKWSLRSCQLHCDHIKRVFVWMIKSALKFLPSFFHFSFTLHPDLLSLQTEGMYVDVWLCCFCAGTVMYRFLTTLVACESHITSWGNLHNSPEELVCSTVYTKTTLGISSNSLSKCFAVSCPSRYPQLQIWNKCTFEG